MRVLLTATVQSHICQFHRPLVEVLHEYDCEVHVAARDNLAEKNGLKLDFVEKVYDVPFARSPKSRDNWTAYRQLKKLMEGEKYDLVVCNTPMGGVITRLAARNARRRGTKVIYIAHGFHFCKGAPRKNWLLFYPIEKILARFCDLLVTITDEDYMLANAKFRTKVAHIHGVGVSPTRYHPISVEEAEILRQREGIAEADFTILCTGELNKNKNQVMLIEAAARCREEIPNLCILLAGNGSLEGELREKVKTLGLDDTVKFLGYRTDLENVTPFVDVVVSCSYREGLPLNILEAMLCGKPVIASVNRGHKELIVSGENGFLFQPGDVNILAEQIQQLYHVLGQRQSMGKAGFERAQAYTVEMVKQELTSVFEELNQDG